MKFVIAYDIGTTGVKTCLFQIDDIIKLIASSSMGYNLYILENGGAEQDADEWLKTGMVDVTCLCDVDINNMTPLQAFDLIRSMKKELGL